MWNLRYNSYGVCDMNSTDYNEVILKKIESTFNKLMPISAIVSAISAIAVNFSAIPKAYVIYDSLIAFGFIALYLFKNKVTIEKKIMFAILISLFMGMLSFIDGGFSSAGIILFLLGNILAVLFLSKRHSTIIAILTMVGFGALWVWTYVNKMVVIVEHTSGLWIIQFVVMLLYLIFTQTAVYAVKGYLIDNIGELEKSKAKSDQLAYYDQLTGLPNQIMFKQLINEKAVNIKDMGYIVFLNVKDIRLINTLYGEIVGDQVLKEVGQTLHKLKNNDEILARCKGNEFGLWVELDIEMSIENRIDALITEFKDTFLMLIMKKEIEFDVGYSSYEYGISSIQKSYQQATIALSYARKDSSVRSIGYTDELDQIIRREEYLKELLKNAVKNRGFELYFQPQVNIIHNKVIGVEALARWKEDNIGHIGPYEFIPLVEELNLSIAFGKMTVDMALDAYSGLCQKYNEDITLSINISPTFLIDDHFAEFILGSIKRKNINPSRIILEITEDILIKGAEFVNSVTEPLRNKGIKISLDDFGSGYSSLNYLMNLKIDEMKIDKTFVDQILKGEKTLQLVELLVGLARNYGLNVVAEGVETIEQNEQMFSLGCHIIQGYYHFKPEPL